MEINTFPSVAMKVAKSVTITPLTAILGHFNRAFVTALTCMGLLRRPFLDGFSEEDDSAARSMDDSNFVLIMDGGIPSLVHVHVLTSQIKRRLPVVKHREITKGEEEEATCLVCLSNVVEGDEVRELSNCGHVFHRGCLDCWVDEGHVTCPLCRSLLFPSDERGCRRGGREALVLRSEQETAINGVC